jgi:hypothetical protein
MIRDSQPDPRAMSKALSNWGNESAAQRGLEGAERRMPDESQEQARGKPGGLYFSSITPLVLPLFSMP